VGGFAGLTAGAMAPSLRKGAKDGTSKEAGPKDGSSKRRRQEADAADHELLDRENVSRWTDSFLVLSIARWAVERVYCILTQRDSNNGSTSAKKKGEKEVIPLKQQILQWMDDFKIPLGLLAIFVLTCAIIAGGEHVSDHEERVQKPAEDYYGVLGVPRNAETADVKRAYKTLAKRWHPDRNPDCSTCQETFAKIAVAYETLSDTEKRSQYDESGSISTTELKSPKSTPLTRENFDELVTFSNDVWIVQLFKPEDGSSAQFHPFWENMIQKHGHLVRFGRVDVTHDQGKWLPVKMRVLPMVLKYGRHLGSPEIFPITAMHDTAPVLMKFVLQSFPNMGLPLDKDKQGLTRWLRTATRQHKVLFAIPGKSEDERYKSHLVPRKLAARWSEIFEFRTAETAKLHKLSKEHVPDQVRNALPPANESTSKAAVMFFTAGSTETPTASAFFSWPASEEEIVLQLLSLAELAAPALSARSAELLCRSLAIRRVYCLVMMDQSDAAVAKAVTDLKESRERYRQEVEDIRASGGEVTEEEDNFVVYALRLFRQPKGLQPSIATCWAPKFPQVEKGLAGASAFIMDMDMGRIAALKGLTTFKGVYQQIAYEDSLKWLDDVLHPFRSLPDCNEGIAHHFRRALRSAPAWELLIQLLTAIFFAEALAKACMETSIRWAAGACALLLLILLRSPPFLRFVAAYLPGSLFAPPLITS